MSKSAIFLHPDLGIGGAERLIVDAAVALIRSGYKVRMITNHHDPHHCFEETLQSDLSVTVVGNWFPRSFFGHFHALCAYIRMLLATLFILFTYEAKGNIIIVDQISAPLLFFNCFGYKTLFYCHFPDLLLTSRTSFLKRLYRFPIDWLEEFATGRASTVVVNSKFTAEVFHQTFTSLQHIKPSVLYPVPNADSLVLPQSVIDSEGSSHTSSNRPLARQLLQTGVIPPLSKIVFLSINRYERKKNLIVALYALNHLLTHWDELVDQGHNCDEAVLVKPNEVHLLMAGGYDTRVRENVEHYEELLALSKQLGIESQVTFIRSCPSDMKALLICASDAVLYTPFGEHFGIVPVEAMFMSRPVIALDSGGPRESVLHGSTGYLCSVTSGSGLAASFATNLARFINDPALTVRLGRAGRRRATETFSFAAFQKHLCDILSQL